MLYVHNCLEFSCVVYLCISLFIYLFINYISTDSSIFILYFRLWSNTTLFCGSNYFTFGYWDLFHLSHLVPFIGDFFLLHLLFLFQLRGYYPLLNYPSVLELCSILFFFFSLCISVSEVSIFRLTYSFLSWVNSTDEPIKGIFIFIIVFFISSISFDSS